MLRASGFFMGCNIGARLSYKGYGNTEMLFPNWGATEAEQEKNRRPFAGSRPYF